MGSDRPFAPITRPHVNEIGNKHAAVRSFPDEPGIAPIGHAEVIQ